MFEKLHQRTLLLKWWEGAVTFGNYLIPLLKTTKELSLLQGAFALERRKIAGHPELAFFKFKSYVFNFEYCSSNIVFLALQNTYFPTRRLSPHEND